MSLTLCVYCGSRDGDDPAHLAAAREVGRQIGERGWRLVYGGGSTGLMGAVADAALAHGAEAIGIIPERLVKKELGHPGLTSLEIVDSMHERKHRMAMHADAFVALPGGIGTMEEMFEMWTSASLGFHYKPVVLYDPIGFYTPLLDWIRGLAQEGLVHPEALECLVVRDDLDAALDACGGRR